MNDDRPQDRSSWRDKVYTDAIESDIDALYENNRRALNAIFGLCIAMTMHVIGTYLIVRKLRRG